VRGKDAGATRRMLALALVLEGFGRAKPASSAAWTGRPCVWVLRYNAENFAGLCHRRAAGPKPRLPLEQEAAVVEPGCCLMPKPRR
jgi:hypothetical protein